MQNQIKSRLPWQRMARPWKMGFSVAGGALVGRLLGEVLVWLMGQPANVSDWFIPFFFLGEGVAIWVFPLIQAPALDAFSTATVYTGLGALLGYAPLSKEPKRYLKHLIIGIVIYALASYIFALTINAFTTWLPDLRFPE